MAAISWARNHHFLSPIKSHARHLPVVMKSSHRELSTKKQAVRPALWKSFKAPVLFGAGLYFGLMIFGEHQETRQGSSYFEGLRYKFWNGDERGTDFGKKDES
mmetsp:Transcript_8970/g.21806  ORF Transcript_8970/g.21806 Transcript_8970/m.21806 type:complete len:103 (-) Transcript_8970:196-504(-)|eukprot:CAMPEP_0181097074 /NCGR_PEP_ID=MMETSP1071-20121207/11371_1 /TAXON_ID=35127 /ORGANISM="Thalassiosira sp., Strain NH16" /LENGTH=102 /DNA_ID=CAMNT_0023179523 /DNA_START=96 /DNA_END=404 /DNA_ORIENTATION=-